MYRLKTSSFDMFSGRGAPTRVSRRQTPTDASPDTASGSLRRVLRSVSIFACSQQAVLPPLYEKLRCLCQDEMVW